MAITGYNKTRTKNLAMETDARQESSRKNRQDEQNLDREKSGDERTTVDPLDPSRHTFVLRACF
jgi:hypothetical protein